MILDIFHTIIRFSSLLIMKGQNFVSRKRGTGRYTIHYLVSICKSLLWEVPSESFSAGVMLGNNALFRMQYCFSKCACRQAWLARKTMVIALDFILNAVLSPGPPCRYVWQWENIIRNVFGSKHFMPWQIIPTMSQAIFPYSIFSPHSYWIS